MTKQKPWNANNSNDLWAIKSPEGFIYPLWIGTDKRHGIENFKNNINGFVSWKHAYRLGYRAVKIRIVEME